MLEKPNRKKIDKQDGNRPTNIEQLIEKYDLEKIWPYIERIVDYIIEQEGIIVNLAEPMGSNRRKIWIQHSNNVFNKITSTKKQYIDDSGNYGQSETSDLSDFIPVISNTNYIAKGYGNTAQTKRIAFFNSSKVFISTKTSLNDTNSTFSFKTLSNASYIRVQYFNDIEDSLDIRIEPKIYVKNDNDVYEKLISKDDLINYSTEEQRIGTWIDGKPLYRKVVSGTFGTVVEGTQSEVNIIIPNAKFVLVKDYWLDRIATNNSINQGFVTNTLELGYTSTSSSNAVIRLRTKQSFVSNVTVYAIVEYTKTTD